LFAPTHLVNKMCRSKQLTPKYINIGVNGHNKQSTYTKAAATRIRFNQELKFLYCKKQHLNECLYCIHLHCLTAWDFTWQHIQDKIDSQIHTIMDTTYRNLNKKTRQLRLPNKTVHIHTHKQETVLSKSYQSYRCPIQSGTPQHFKTGV
jgi:undecaprenyl pyrophosphate synthase